MSATMRDAGGVLRNVSSIVMRSGGVARTISSISERGPDGVLRLVWSGVTIPGLAANPATAEGTRATTTAGTKVVTSNTVTITGAPAGSTYAWSLLESSGAVVANYPAIAATSFSGTLAVDEERTATFRCTVTPPGRPAATIDVPVTLHLVYTGIAS